MTRLVRAELLKQRTAPVFLLAFAVTPVLAVLVVVAVYGGAGRQGNDPLGPHSLVQILSAPASIVTTLALLLGVVGLAGEYRHKTITTTLLASPRRGRVVAAELVAHALTGGAMAVVTTLATAAVAVPWLLNAGVDVELSGRIVRVTGGLFLSTVLHGALGVAVAALARNQTAAVAVVLVWLLAVEDVVAGLSRSWAIANWLPVALARDLVQVGPGATSPWVAAAALTAYVAGFAAIAGRWTVGRDIT